MNELIKYTNSDNMLEDICQIIDAAQHFAFSMVDYSLVIRNWCIGKRISKETLKGENRAAYGAEIINNLAKELSLKYGKGYSKRALYQYLRFYRMFPKIVHEVRTQSNNGIIVNEASAQLGSLLSWTHYRILTQVENDTVRRWNFIICRKIKHKKGSRGSLLLFLDIFQGNLEHAPYWFSSAPQELVAHCEQGQVLRSQVHLADPSYRYCQCAGNSSR